MKWKWEGILEDLFGDTKKLESVTLPSIKKLLIFLLL
jgi:hypothetical protein